MHLILRFFLSLSLSLSFFCLLLRWMFLNALSRVLYFFHVSCLQFEQLNDLHCCFSKLSLLHYSMCILQRVVIQTDQCLKYTNKKEWRKNEKENQKKTFRKTSTRVRDWQMSMHTKYNSVSEKSDNCNQRSKSIDELTSSFWLLF